MESNLTLWDSVCKTDPAFTKQAKKGAYHFTAIAPMYQFKMATEHFGPQGIGWGIEPGSETFSENTYGTTVILAYDAILFYKHDGEIGRIPVHASEKIGYQTQGNNGYFKVDDEVRKKVVTNAKTKGLSELGFNADVFMGQFDDPNYVDYRNLEEGIAKAENQQEEIESRISEFNDWCKKELTVYPSLKDKRTLGIVLNGHLSKVDNRCKLLGLNYDAYSSRFINTHDKQLEKIKGK